MGLSTTHQGPGSVAIALLLFKGGSALAAPPAAPDDARGAFAVYCPDRCGEVSLVDATLKRVLPRTARKAVYTVERHGTEFGIPDAETLQTWGVGEVGRLPSAQAVVVIRWAGPSEDAAELVLSAGRAAAAAGRWVEDLDSGRVYGADAFAAALDGFVDSQGGSAGAAADVTGLMVVDGNEQADGQSVRLFTRGLHKVGLPDLVVANVPAAREGELSVALNGVAQALYERGAASGMPSRVSVDAGALRSRRAAEGLCEVQGEARLRFTSRRGDDPPGPLAEVQWEGTVGQCADISPPPAGATPPPSGPLPVSPPKTAPTAASPSDLDSARAAAQVAIDTTIRARFVAGEAGVLMVKAPFTTTAGGVEWLWMTVDRWDADDVLIGRMANEPDDVPGLRKGARVSARVPQVFDYLWTFPDGTVEGNQTAALLE